jgi:hypothetical protein
MAALLTEFQNRSPQPCPPTNLYRQQQKHGPDRWDLQHLRHSLGSQQLRRQSFTWEASARISATPPPPSLRSRQFDDRETHEAPQIKPHKQRACLDRTQYCRHDCHICRTLLRPGQGHGLVANTTRMRGCQIRGRSAPQLDSLQ